ncbi:peptidylprolyl isomerase SurA [Vibrio caribbeanicus]|uniref:Chaperone SurA n=1 Tax=Vibrio caribbeanicus ATCC BAA-2122 TaxID=796620 RepID=E3BLY7_9VIBR|nr:peptidylprolyl isomerase SurA [Vibrio caribbeanicus]EFP95915.1 survival protein SurA [Vibrio caribbeanicus ATCC BAA-2122]
MKLWNYIILAFLSLNINHAVAQQEVALDQVAVIVNDGVILQSDIKTAMKTLKINAKKEGQTLPSNSVLEEQVTEKLILDTIQQQQADRIGVKVDDGRLNEAIEEIAKNNQQTIAELKEELQKEGLNYALFRDQVRKEISVSEARNAIVRRRINILPSEVDHLASLLSQESSATVQYKIGHIQLRVEDGDDKAQIKQQAMDIVSELEKGADFKTMAYTFSKGPKALKGGDWGWMRKEEMPTIFADEIKMQNKGSIIGPFMSGSGFHILKIEDVKGLQTVAVTEVNARHILIKPSIILSDEGVKKELIEITKRIKSGEVTFSQMAKQYSQDTGSGTQGGELGFHTSDIYVPEFKHQLDTLPIGQISAPFKTVHGWHIVEVTGRKQVDRTDASLKNKAYRIIFNRKFNEEAGAWLQEIRAGAFVEMIGDDV